MPQLTVEQAKKRFQGVVIPLTTIFKEDGSLDIDSTQENFQWIVDEGGKQGNTIFLAAGSGGDFTTMTTEERKAVIRAAAEVSDGKIPTIAGVQSTDIRVTIELCQFGEEVGIDLAQISNSFYYDCKEEDVIAWHEEVARNTNLAFAAYSHWYSGSKYDVPADLIGKLLDIPNTIALKWASPDVNNWHAGITQFLDRAAVIDNGFLPVLGHQLGARGWISHVPNYYPHHSWKVHELMTQGRYTEAQILYDEFYIPYGKLLGTIGSQTAGEGVFVRPGLAAAGRHVGISRLPSRDSVVTPEIREAFRKLIEANYGGAISTAAD